MTEEPQAPRTPPIAAPKRDAPTIKDIAKLLGVSYATVSRALNDHHHTSEKVKARVQAAVEELGYVPHLGARMMRSQTSRVIGLVIPDLSNQIFVGTAATLAEQCRKAGYQLVLSISNRDAAHECALVESLIHLQAAGIVIAPCGDSLERTRSLLHQLPCVQLGDRNPELDVPTVRFNDQEAARAATQHLLQLGHRRIGYLGGEDDIRTHSERLAGYRRALAEAGIGDVGEDMVLCGPVTVEWGRLSMGRLLASANPPTAVLVTNSTQTRGAVDSLREARIAVPGEISIIGFGDLDWCDLWTPGLTTVDLPLAELAQAVSWHLFEQMPKRGSFVPRKPFVSSLTTKLVVRGSTGPCRSAP